MMAEGDAEPALTVGLLRLEKLSLPAMMRLAGNPAQVLAPDLGGLAEGLSLEDFELYFYPFTLSLSSLTASLPSLSTLTAAGLHYRNHQSGDGLELAEMSAEGVDAAALSRMAEEGEALNFLMFCDALDLTQGAVFAGGEELLGIRRAVFDVNENEGAAAFSRRLELILNLPALAAKEERLAGEPAFMAMTKASGGVMDLNLNLKLDYRAEGGLLAVRECELEAPGLGRLSLMGRLSSMPEIKPSFTPYQLLFSATGGALENFSCSFTDQGFMAAWYEALDKTIFARSPSRNGAENLMTHYVSPLAETLGAESGLMNLPAIVGEIRAFLDRPEKLALNMAPAAPLPFLTLAKLDKYDIMEKLNLTVQINRRAPFTVEAASAVNHENLPSAPRPDENSITEENLEFQ